MRKIAFVFVGGFCGTLARYLLSAPLQALASGLPLGARGALPYDILVINLTGAATMGLLYGLVERGAAIPPEARLALGTGFLGAYTTFSSLAYGGDQLLASGAVVAGIVYLAGSVILGSASARAGYLIAGHHIAGRLGASGEGRAWRRRGATWPVESGTRAAVSRLAQPIPVRPAVRPRKVTASAPPSAGPRPGHLDVAGEVAPPPASQPVSGERPVSTTTPFT
jgi:CrcB protein